MAVMVGMYNSAAGLIALPQAVEEGKTLTRSFGSIPAISMECTAAGEFPGAARCESHL